MSDTAADDDVARKLRALQDFYGLTLQEMADRCGLPKRSLENYIRTKKPQRPGLDALRSMADGLEVSIDWLIGRTDEAFAPEFSTEDYALFCHGVVLRLLADLIPLASNEPSAFDDKKLTIKDVEHTDIAASAMLEFIEVVRIQSGNKGRPEGYFGTKFRVVSESAKQRGTATALNVPLHRKP